jgi:membrane fusion protein, multidrug efflux system
MRFTKTQITLFCALLVGAALTWLFLLSDGSVKHPAESASSAASDAVPRHPFPASGAGPESSHAGVLSVQTTRPVRRDIVRSLSLPANIAPWYQATLYAKVPGYVREMKVDKGDEVVKGQLLAVLDAPEVEQQFRQAEADYKIKSLTHRRLLKVWKENPDVIAKQDLDVAEATAEGAKHLMDNRRTLYEYTRVEAPFGGTITARFADPGTMIQSGAGSATQAAPLYTLMDLDQVRVYINVPQEAAHLAKPGVPATLSLKELPGKPLHGAITRTTEALDPASRTLLVEIDMPNEQRLLQPGMFVSVTLELERHPQALSLPPNAIAQAATGSSRSAVFVVNQGTITEKPVTTGIDDGMGIEIKEGLSDEDEVVVVGKTGLKDGAHVRASPFNLPVGQPSRQKY